MFLIARRNGCSVAMYALTLLALSACDHSAEQGPVNFAHSKIPVPEVLLAQATATELFSNGATIFAVLNVYDANDNLLITSNPSTEIGATSSTSEVSWSNIDLKGDLSQYFFEVVWKSTRYASIDGKMYSKDGGIDWAISATKEKLTADNTLMIRSYNTTDLTRLDANGDQVSNLDAIVKNEDPLGCYLDASNLDQCRLF